MAPSLTHMKASTTILTCSSFTIGYFAIQDLVKAVGKSTKCTVLHGNTNFCQRNQ